MQNTKIQWTDHTVNFWWGCTKVSRACQHCYAQEVASRYGKRLFGQPVEWGAGKPRFERLIAARKEALKIEQQAMKTGTRPRVFVNSMSDWLDDEVPLEWLAFLLETLFLCPNVDFQLLTKRPENWEQRLYDSMLHAEKADLTDTEPYRDGTFCRWLEDWKDGQAPDNLWIGTTVEDQKAADTRIPHLLHIPGVRFLSCEPLVGVINLDVATQGLREGSATSDWEQKWHVRDGIHWVIAGGESGGHAEPSHPEWFRSLRDQCASAGVPFFFKQWGEWIALDNMQPHMDRRAYKGHHCDDGTLMLRVGTKTAGDLLDGQQHHAFPA